MKVVNVALWIVTLPLRIVVALFLGVLALGMTDWSNAYEREQTWDMFATLVTGNILK